jgi:hypothetical protein
MPLLLVTAEVSISIGYRIFAHDIVFLLVHLNIGRGVGRVREYLWDTSRVRRSLLIGGSVSPSIMLCEMQNLMLAACEIA